MKHLFKSYTSFAILALILSACSQKAVDEQAHTDHAEEEGVVELNKAQFERASIIFGKLETKNMSSTLSMNGVLVVPPQYKVSVSPMMGGFIKTTNLQEGLPVKKGQVIATIQNPDFIQIQSSYLENKSKLVYLKAEYKRQQELAAENVAATKIFQQVSSELTTLEFTNQALEEQLKLLNINVSTLSKQNIRSTVNVYSPINGVITQVGVNIGTFVHPQDVICQIIDSGHLLAEFTVFEKDLSKIKKGQKIRFVIMNEGDKERTATLSFINYQITTERTLKAFATIDKHDADLMPNMYLKAFLEISDAKVHVLPSEAIVAVGEKSYVFIKENHTGHKDEHPDEAGSVEFKAIEIQTGVTQNEYTEVILPKELDLLKEQIVIKGAYAILSKMNNSEEGHAH